MTAHRVQALELPRRYISMPEQTTFLESACHNPGFRPHSVFIPVSAEGSPGVSGLYEVNLRSDEVRKRCALPSAGMYFGCKLSASGQCYICVGNQGRILAVDLASPDPRAQLLAELPAHFEPNDLALDEAGGRLLLACNDTRFDVLSVRGQTLNALHIAASGGGAVFSLELERGQLSEIASGMRVLAGAVCVPEDRALWLSELNNLVRVPLDAPQSWERVPAFDPQLLADNMDAAGTELLFPYYRRVSKLEALIMRSAAASKLLFALLRYMPERLFGAPPPAGEAADQFEDVHFGLYDFATKRARSYRLPSLHASFDGHCTAVERVDSELVFVNYLKKELLVVDARSLW